MCVCWGRGGLSSVLWVKRGEFERIRHERLSFSSKFSLIVEHESSRSSDKFSSIVERREGQIWTYAA